MKIIFTGKDYDATHNFATSLDYGYSTIRSAMQIAQMDPREQWFGLNIDEDATRYEHAVRFNRKTLRWEVGTNGQ